MTHFVYLYLCQQTRWARVLGTPAHCWCPAAVVDSNLQKLIVWLFILYLLMELLKTVVALKY